MKRVYNALGAQPGGLGHRLRNVLEFCGGVTDNYLSVTSYAARGRDNSVAPTRVARPLR